MKLTNHISIKDIPIILHTVDSYSQYWDSWFYFFNKHCADYLSNIIFCSEEKQPTFSNIVQTFQTGHGAWGKRLLKILDALDNKYIFYMQEDFWAIKNFPFNQDICNIAQEDEVNCFRISAPCISHNLLKVRNNIYQYKQNSSYTLSHQFSMWDKQFFTNAVLEHEDPWANEIEGSKRINQTPHKIYYIPIAWYIATVRHGNLTRTGKIMQEEAMKCR